LKKIGAIAEAYRIEMAPHNPQSLVSTLASIHVDATTPNSVIQEYAPKSDPYTTDLFKGAKLEISEGFAALPTRPVWDAILDEKVAAQRPYKPAKREAYKFKDGSIADQ
jgi:galactonate dehydratase